MLEKKFPELHSRASVTAAEDILELCDSATWGAFISNAYQSDWMSARAVREANGTKEITDGTYRFY